MSGVPLSTTAADKSAMFRSGYILARNADLVWFLALPYLALGAALACQQWLSAVTVAAVSLWITIPHHFATWVRAYGISEDRKRWRSRLIIGPIVLFAMALLAVKWAPITLVIVALVWDSQHALMQQHGFARIYDFKAKTGAKSTGRFDLCLNWVLFGNLMLTSPFFTTIWLRQLYELHLPISPATVTTIQEVSWAVTLAYSLVYLGHLGWLLSRGYAINPVKYLFLGSSYFMWYFTAWHTSSILVYTIAAQLMHGIQYIVISYMYTRRRSERSSDQQGWAAKLVRPGNLTAFLVVCFIYAFVYQLLVGGPLEVFGLGFVRMPPELSMPLRSTLGFDFVTEGESYDVFAGAVVAVAAMTHYYFDSFIWKVSDQKTQAGL